MVRTKHLIMLILALALSALVFFLCTRTGGGVGLSTSSPMPTFVEESSTLLSAVPPDDARESERTSLIARLKEQLSKGQVAQLVETATSDTDSAVTEPVTDEIEVADVPLYTHTPTRGSVYSCNGGVIPHTPVVRTWGTPLITRAEGARIFTVSETVASGTPIATTIFQVPEDPYVLRAPLCLTRDAVGLMHDGTPIYTATPHQGGSTPDADGRIGFALDGFALYGAYENGAGVDESTLDACHGHVGLVQADGVLVSRYHYHMTDTYPYTVGCFVGAPAGQL